MIRKAWRGVTVVATSALADPSVVERALEAGAAGFISKQLSVQEMLRQLESALARRRSGLALGRRRTSARGGSKINVGTLSRRELEVLEGIRKGQTNREIASALGISTATVNKHVESVLRKLKARNRAHAASMI